MEEARTDVSKYNTFRIRQFKENFLGLPDSEEA
jgi:hypothetical protein